MSARTKQIRLIAIAVAVILLIVLILQNTETTRTQVLFATIEMPRALMLVTTAGLGFIAGLLTAWRVGKR